MGLKTCKKGLHQYDDGKKRCPECQRERVKKWQQANSEKITEYRFKYSLEKKLI